MPAIQLAFYGRVCDATGFGTSARAYVHALHRAGVDLSVFNLDFGGPIHDPLIESLMNRPITADFHLVHETPVWAVPLRAFARKLIVSTSWETEKIPGEWIEFLNSVREIWVPCEHNVSVFRKQVTTPVFKWPHAILPSTELSTEPSQCGNRLPDASRLPPLRDSDFVFYSVFVWQKRKHPNGMIEAFFRAFPDRDDVVLILKTPGLPPENANVVEEIRRDVPSRARVEIVDELWSLEQLEALTRRGDCYLSLHRGEGWCNPLFDAACRGKPVVATAYSGPLEYLNPDDHCLVKYQLVPVDQRYRFYNSGMQWAAPDLDHAAQLMRQIYEDRERASQRAARAAVLLPSRFSSQAIGELAKNRLELLSGAVPRQFSSVKS